MLGNWFEPGDWSNSPMDASAVARTFHSAKVSIMTHMRAWSGMVVGSLILASAACRQSERTSVDSAAGSIENTVRTALAVIDVDMGRHIDDEKKISDKTDDFAPSDTIYASVHTSGTANNSQLIGRWTFQDSTMVDERTDSVTASGDAHTVFFITKPSGLPAGKYTLHVLIDGKEVRTKDVDVK